MPGATSRYWVKLLVALKDMGPAMPSQRNIIGYWIVGYDQSDNQKIHAWVAASSPDEASKIVAANWPKGTIESTEVKRLDWRPTGKNYPAKSWITARAMALGI